MTGRKVTHTILTSIAVVFALIAGLSAIAWLMPAMFNSLGNYLIRITGSNDIAFNVNRISRDPIQYALSFAILALGAEWLSSKF